MKTQITHEEIDAAKSAKGGFKRATLEQWGVPWPPPKGWRKTIVAHGYPYDATLNTFGEKTDDGPEADLNVTQESLQRMMDASAPQMVDGDPFECVGELDIDPARLLRKVVSSVIAYGHSEILWEFPEVLAFFGSRIPQRDEVSHLHNVDERMFEAADKWPNRKSPSKGEAA